MLRQQLVVVSHREKLVVWVVDAALGQDFRRVPLMMIDVVVELMMLL